MRRIVMSVLISAAVIATTVTALAASPKALRTRIVAATLARTSVHRTSNYSWSLPQGSSGVTETADLGPDAGTELAQFRVDDHRGSARILLVRDTVYARGDALGLERALGLSARHAKRYAGRWISIPKSDKVYAGLADRLTFASVVGDIPRGHLRLSRRTWGGKRFIVLYGSSRSWALYIHARGSRLPVGFFRLGVSSRASGSFSRWDEPVHVHAPASSTPIATVRGS